MAKVISGEKYWAYLKSQEIIDKAQAKAEKIIEESVIKSKQAQEKAYEEGIEIAKAQSAEHMLNASIVVIDYFSSVEDKMVDLLMSSIRKVLGDMDPSEVISRVVSNALGIMRNQKQVSLRVSAEDMPRVKERLNQIMATYPGMSFLDVIEDSRLSKGGCILESDMGVVDASLEKQITTLETAMRKRVGADNKSGAVTQQVKEEAPTPALKDKKDELNSEVTY